MAKISSKFFVRRYSASFGKMAAMGMAGLLLFDLTLAVGVTSMSTVSDTTMMSIRSNGCKKTSAQSSSDMVAVS